MTVPSNRSWGALTGTNNTSNISVVAGTVNSGDLLALFAWTRVTSNISFPAGFTKQEEVRQTVGAAAIAWKWATTADSGSTFVCSANASGGNGAVFCGVAAAFADVESHATPLKNFLSRVGSVAYFATASHQTFADSHFTVAVGMQFDNQGVTLTGLTAASYSLVHSRYTTTGSDAGFIAFSKIAASSGAYFVPASGAATVHPWYAATFGLNGAAYVGQVFTPTLTDTFSMIDGTMRVANRNRALSDSHSLSDTANILHTRRVTDGSGLLAITDSGKRELTWEVIAAAELLSLSDEALQDIISGGGTIYTLTRTDVIEMADSILKMRRLTRILSESGLLALLDSGEVRRILRVVAEDELDLLDSFIKNVVTGGTGGTVYPVTLSDTTTLIDTALRVAYRVRSLGDNITASDEKLFARTLNRALTETLMASDQILQRTMRNRIVQEAIGLSDATMSVLLRNRTLTDAAVMGDGLTLYRRLTRTRDDSISLLDSLLSVKLGSQIKVMSDGMELSDGVLSSSRKTRLAQDFISAFDSIIAGRLVSRLMSDYLTADDKRSYVLFINRSETAAITDGIFTRRQLLRILSDSATLQDFLASMVAGGATFRTASDFVVLMDEVRVAARRTRVISDLLAVDDKRSMVLSITRGDSVNVSDGMQIARIMVRALQDALTIGDSLSKLTGVTFRTSSDSITISDGIQRVIIYRRVVGDAIVLSDYATAITAGVKLRTLSDTVVVTDEGIRGVIRNRRLQDLVSAITDQAVKGVVKWRILQDAVSPQDFALKMLARVALLSENMTLSDGALTGIISVRRLSDVLEATDSFTKIFFDALAGLLDVRILIGFQEPVIDIGSDKFIFIGADIGPELGGYN